MKNIAFLSILTILLSCNKGEYPKISIETELLSNGDIVVKGTLLNKDNETNLNNYFGYCYSSTDPKVTFATSSQKFFSYNSSFTDTISSQNLQANTTYYFKVFGTNDYGRGESEIKSINVSGSSATSPCGLPNNTYKLVNDLGNTYSVGVTSQGYLYNSTSSMKVYRCSLPGGQYLDFYFKIAPNTGTYTINSSSLTNNSSAVIYDNIPSSNALSGNVIITKINNNQFKIDMCSVPWYNSGYDYASLSTYCSY